MNTDAPASIPTIGPFELWMLSQGVMGLVAVGGMMFLIPAYVVDQGGSPADAGAVMAVAGALALSAPFLGSVADRFRAHRGLQLLSLTLLAAAAVSFAFAEQELIWLVAATLLGLGMAGLGVVNATFVVGAGFDEATEARKLSLLQLSLPCGQVLGLALVAALSGAGQGFQGRFLILAAVAVAAIPVVAAVDTGAANRITTPEGKEGRPAPDQAERTSLRSVVLSQFGLTFLLVVLVMASANAIESQYPNYMNAVFDISPSQSAGALAVIVLVSIPIYPVAGRWTARSGPRAPFLVSAAARAAAGAGLLLLPGGAGGVALIVFGIMMIVYPLFELNAATLAARTSPIGPGAGQGAVAAAFALGTIAASITAGWVADQIGYSSLATISLVSAGAAALVGVVALRPAGRSSSG